jgi:hypothetical protein
MAGCKWNIFYFQSKGNCEISVEGLAKVLYCVIVLKQISDLSRTAF